MARQWKYSSYQTRKVRTCKGCKAEITLNRTVWALFDGEGHWISFCSAQCREAWLSDQRVRREQYALSGKVALPGDDAVESKSVPSTLYLPGMEA